MDFLDCHYYSGIRGVSAVFETKSVNKDRILLVLILLTTVATLVIMYVAYQKLAPLITKAQALTSNPIQGLSSLLQA